MKQLGNGNLSLGIRKAIDMTTYNRRQQIINKIADIIVGRRMDEAAIDAANQVGWTIDIRFPGAEYSGENEWSRFESLRLEPDELAQAKQLAAELEATLR